jgi:uncharacterized protein with PIN domain
MLTQRLKQIKDILESKKTSGFLSKEEFDLLNEITFFEENEEIQIQLLSSQRVYPINEILEPAPDRCPACGRKF